VPLIVTETERAVKISEFLKDKGFWVRAIRYPTVPAGQERLRFSLTYHHSREILGKLAEQMGKAEGTRQ
jgi:8-amino-7-oxononanoate synthase